MAVVGRRDLVKLVDSVWRAVSELFGVEVSQEDIARLISRYGLRSYLIVGDEEAAVLEDLLVEGRSSWGSRHA